MLVQERDYEGIRHLLSREPSLANAGVTLGPPCSTTAHPLHRICDAVFAKLISDDEAVKVAKILLEHGARIDGDSSTENADTPLMAAASLHAENLGIFYIQTVRGSICLIKETGRLLCIGLHIAGETC